MHVHMADMICCDIATHVHRGEVAFDTTLSILSKKGVKLVQMCVKSVHSCTRLLWV